MLREIGSDFEWDQHYTNETAHSLDWLPVLPAGDSILTFSGRQAIELAIADMKKSRTIETVYMPAYCCDSMTAPFMQNDIEILYYDVTYEQGKGLHFHIDSSADVDLFFAMSYFGLGDSQVDEVITTFKGKNKIIIEDITHRLFSELSHSLKADYAIASLRKSLPIPTGGYLTKAGGTIFNKPQQPGDLHIAEKITAMKEKQAYLEGQGDTNDKDTFLKKFTAFNQAVANVPNTYRIDNTSREILTKLDIEAILEQRRENAQVLYAGIKNLTNIGALIPNPNLETNVPIFVPIMLPSQEARDRLRKALIAEQIYCPVHWPQANSVNAIWTTELSLICDQRYTKEDMERQLEVIATWQENDEND